ncbi:MAG: hemerythrin domain-containing protein, partial [Dehalococcoidales bacterium]
MVNDKSCPGARTIREPIPEYINCTECDREVEIWTDEMKAVCPGCGSKVYRAQQASCIDWCPHAEECVGPEAYERLKAGEEEDEPEAGTALDVLKREHERALDNIGLLHAASLCLNLGSRTPGSVITENWLDHLAKVLVFFEKDIGLLFRREEELLFPALEEHLGQEKSPTRLLVGEHREIWGLYEQLKEKLVELQGDGS